VSSRHTHITQQEARRVMNKIDSASGPVALFANGCGSYTTVRVKTDSFNSRLNKYPATLVGVFDINATVSLLEDELAAVNVK
jgi:hypothetical protein